MSETLHDVPPEITQDEADLVVAALRRDEFDFRTAEGIEKDTGVEAARVTQFLDASPTIARRPFGHKDLAREPKLYAPVEQRISLREVLSHMHAILAKRY